YQEAALVHAGQPYRVHDLRHRHGNGGRAQRHHLLHRPPHRGADHALPHRGAHRTPERQHVDQPHRGAARCGTGHRGALLHPRAEPGRHTPVLRLPRQACAVQRGRRAPQLAHLRGHWGWRGHLPAHPLRARPSLEHGVLAPRRRGREVRVHAARSAQRSTGREQRRRSEELSQAHDRRHRGNGGPERRPHRVRGAALRVELSRRRKPERAEQLRRPGLPRGGGLMPENRARLRRVVLHQIPMLVWLVFLWMLLWGSFSWLTILTGVIVAVLVTRVFYLPPLALSGRFNLWWALVFAVHFAYDLFRASVEVAWIAIDPRKVPSSSVVAVQLRSRSDL